MEKQITIYHGSEQLVETPTFGEGKKNNDFGQGFYCTESEALAKEWAVSSLRNGFANRYTLDTEFLNVLHLNSPDFTILNWIAVLVEHRLFSIKTPVARRAKRYLIDHFSVNVNAYDVIIGYRADDSYFDYAESFLNNGISVEQLAKHCSVSAAYLSLLFQRHLHIAPGAYILRTRLAESCLLLQNGADSIGQIASLLRFSSPQHFSAAFKRQYGMTPSAYVREHGAAE